MELELRTVGMLMFALIMCLWFVLRRDPGDTWQLSLARILVVWGGISLPMFIATILCMAWQADGTLTKVSQSLSGLAGMLIASYLFDYTGPAKEESDEHQNIVA